MDSETAETFFYNVRWFNNFFNDMKSLFDKLGDEIEKNANCSDRWIYYYKPGQFPQIPSTYFLAMQHNEAIKNEGLHHLQIIGVFDDQYIKNEHLKIHEPSLIVIQHDYRDNSTWIGNNILQDYSTKDVVKEVDYIIGILDSDPKIRFRSFIIPLEKFSEYKEKTVYEELISKLDW